MNDTERIREWLAQASRAVESIDAAAVAGAIRALTAVRESGGTIFVAGNGGSANTANHLALDLQKAARTNGGTSRALSLSDNVGLITAWANDESFERVFAAQLEALARRGDALLVFSVSGSSPNLMAALRSARERGLVTVGLLGKDGGAARSVVDHAVIVPSDDYGWVESVHLVLEHVITYALRDGHAAPGAESRVAQARA